MLQIAMHGINLMTLHQQIRKEALPAELGGTQAPYNNQSWAHTLLGDETFSFGHQHIYWPSRTPPPHKSVNCEICGFVLCIRYCFSLDFFFFFLEKEARALQHELYIVH